MTKQYFCGIYGIHFVWRGEWNRPVIQYKRKTVCYYDVEDTLWERYCEEHKVEYVHGQLTPECDTHWKRWVKSHASEVKEIILHCSPV